LAQAITFVREGDVLLTWKLDRLARSRPHLIETVMQLEKSDACLRSLTDAIDTTTPSRRPIFQMFGALAQFERDLTRERRRAGLTAAAAHGRHGGLKPVVTALGCNASKPHRQRDRRDEKTRRDRGRQWPHPCQQGDKKSPRISSALAPRRALPKSAPELNEIERTWSDVKAHNLAHQTFADEVELENALHYAVADMNKERTARPSANIRISA
jgi:hypothetical protein